MHDLRHTAALRMARDRHLSMRDVQTILGHGAAVSTPSGVWPKSLCRGRPSVRTQVPCPVTAPSERRFDHQRVSVQIGAQRALHLAVDRLAQLAVLVSA
jgi:hypothetical protein